MNIDIANGTVYLTDAEVLDSLPRVYLVRLTVPEFDQLSARQRAALMSRFPFELNGNTFDSTYFVKSREEAVQLNDVLRDLRLMRKTSWYFKEVNIITAGNFFTLRKQLRELKRRANRPITMHPLLKSIAEKNAFSAITDMLKWVFKPGFAFN